LDKNPTIAIRVAELAWKNFPNHPSALSIQRIVADAFYLSQQYQIFFFERNLIHSSGVTDAAFSPDGNKIVTAFNDRSAKIWNIQTGKWITNIRRHANTVNSAAFSPDGHKIVTASNDKTAKIWDAKPRI